MPLTFYAERLSAVTARGKADGAPCPALIPQVTEFAIGTLFTTKPRYS